MAASPELSTASNSSFEIVTNERSAKKIARAAISADFSLRQEWLGRTFPATFGAHRDDPNYFGYEGRTLLSAINTDAARDHLRLWAAETMARSMAHLSRTAIQQVGAASGFDGSNFGRGVGYRALSKTDQEGQIAIVAATVGPDWLRPLPAGSTLDPSEHDFYGAISRLPNLLNNDRTRAIIKGRSTRRNKDPTWPVDFSANGLSGIIVEMDDLVLQVTAIDSDALRTFEIPGVKSPFIEGDNTKTIPVMEDAHLIRAWRTKDVA